MARVQVVGGAAVGASINGNGNTSAPLGTQVRAGDTTAGWAVRWFLVATAFLLFFGVLAARRG